MKHIKEKDFIMLISRSDRSKSNMALDSRQMLFSSFLILMSLGAFFIMVSSPKMALNLNLDSHFFTIRHIIFLLLGFLIILLLSQINEKFIKLFSILGIGICLILMAVTLLGGSNKRS